MSKSGCVVDYSKESSCVSIRCLIPDGVAFEMITSEAIPTSWHS